MPEKYFFEIPVFRCTKAQWNLERPIEVKKLAKFLFNDKDLTKKNIDSASFFCTRKIIILLWCIGWYD